MHHTPPPARRTSAAPQASASSSPVPAPPGNGEPLPAQVFRLKRCRTCRNERPLSAFFPQRGCLDSHRPDCKECMAAYTRRQRARQRAGAGPKGERRCRHCGETRPLTDYRIDRRCQEGRGTTCRQCHAVRSAGLGRLAGDLNRPDGLITQNTPLYEQRIDLGIAIAHATCPPGYCRSREELAAFAGVTTEVIRRLEMRALAKMRVRAQQLLAEAGLENLAQVSSR